LPKRAGIGPKTRPIRQSSEDVRKYAAEQGVAEEDALAIGMADKSREFVEKGAEVYAKT